MRPLLRAGTLYVFLLFFFPLHAATEFVFTPGCQEAAVLISRLNLKSATALLEQEKKLRPNNCAVDYLENYIDFYTLITLQDINDLHRLEHFKAGRIERFQELPLTSPYRLYAQAEVNIQWAFSRVFHQEYFKAALEFRDGYRQIEKNTERFPFFAPNFKNKGMLMATLGSIPDNFKWILNFVGMEGNYRQGIDLLGNFVNHQAFASELILEKQSAEYYYTFLCLSVGDKAECWRFCERVTANYPSNMLSCYLRAFMGLKTGHNELALEALNNQPNGPGYLVFPMLDYLKGKALLNKLDYRAAVYFKKFVTFNKGQNLIKDAYKHLSWVSLLTGETDKFKVYRQMVHRYGSGISEEDKAAIKESPENQIPNIALLKARLLYDGGYYEQALKEIPALPLANLDETIEAEYRTGRIQTELHHSGEAVQHFENCIRISGMNSHLHYAPFSCNELGLYFERTGNRNQAVYYFQKALTYKNYPYRGSVQNKAHLGLQRLKS